MNLIQFKQVQGLSSALAQNTSYATAISGYLDGEIWTIMTGDSTFTGQKTFVGDVVFDNVVTGRSSGNFLGGLWVNTDKVLTQADTGTLFVTTVNSQNITGTKTFQGQGSSDNVIFKGGKVTIRKWGSVGETSPELGVSGSLFITGSDGAPFQITRNSPWLNASSDPANGDLYYNGTPTSVLPAQVGIGVIPSHMLDVDGVGNFKSVLADGISGHILSGKTGFLEELQVGAGLDNYWNSGSLVSPFISSTSGNFSSALTLGGQPIVTGSAGGSTAWSNGSSSAIYYNNGNVGIGTGVPTATLHVVGGGQVLQHENGAQAIFSFPGIGGDVKAAQLRLIDSSGNVGVNFISSDKYVFSGGNVGIETDTPTTALDIHGTISLNSQGASSRGLWFGSGTQALGYVGPQNYAVNGLTTGDFGISSAKSDHVFTGSLAFGIGGTERMRIDSFGNVGIGTSTPSAKLSLPTNGDDPIAATPSDGIMMGNALNTYGLNLWHNNSGSTITYFDSVYDSDNSLIQFRGKCDVAAIPVEAMAIKGNGNVGIGITGAEAKLHVTGGKILAPSGDFSESLTISGQSVTQQVSAPASASSAGSLGQTSYDGSYFYVCVSADTWKRAALNTW